MTYLEQAAFHEMLTDTYPPIVDNQFADLLEKLGQPSSNDRERNRGVIVMVMK